MYDSIFEELQIMHVPWLTGKNKSPPLRLHPDIFETN